jgi:hypothetical protein
LHGRRAPEPARFLEQQIHVGATAVAEPLRVGIDAPAVRADQ